MFPVCEFCSFNVYVRANSEPLVLATSVAVERVFSQGRLVLTHVQNRLSAQSTRASMCVGQWSKLGLVKDNDVLEGGKESATDGTELTDTFLLPGWDAIPRRRASS